MMKFQTATFACLACLLALTPATALAATTVTLTLQNHRFTPDSITVPAGERITLILVNRDGAGEEFDSSDLHVEEDVTPHAKISFRVGPLKPGAYRFMGEAHPETAMGRLIAEARAGR
jgi:plastocyanin